MGITGIGTVQTYRYNFKTGKLSNKDGSESEFTSFFNEGLSGDSSKTLNGYDWQVRGGIRYLTEDEFKLARVSGNGLPAWYDPNIDEYEFTCEVVSGEETVFRVNGRDEFLTMYTPVEYTDEEIDAWSPVGKPYKTYKHKEYDPATNSMNIAVGDIFDLGTGYRLRVWKDRVCVEGRGSGAGKENAERLAVALDDLIHFADQQSSVVFDINATVVLRLLRELGVDTSREFNINGTRCIVEEGAIYEAGNNSGVPSSIHRKALERYEELLAKPLSEKKEYHTTA